MATAESLDVIIIGAGAAGLTAGYDLHHDSKHKYKILEASGGLGGRLQKKDDFADFPIDIGGEWIHVPPKVLDNIFADPEWEEQPSDAIDTVAYLETYDEWDDGRWVTQDFGADDYKYVNYTWFDFFNEWMAPDLNIVYNCAVTTVDWSASPVQLSCKDGQQYTAQHVIVTASIGVLQNEDIQFTPALPESVSEAIDTYLMMSGLKVFLSFKERFYKEAFEFASDYENVEVGDRYFYSVAYGQDTGDNVLGVFQVGDPAKRFLSMADQEIYDDILEQLDRVYDRQATPNFIEGFVQNWNEQLFVKGAYTHLTDDYDDLAAINTMRQPLNNRIYFAGEAIPTRNYEYGFAHEAAFSGRAAAGKITELLNNPTRGADRPDTGNGLGSSSSSSALRQFGNDWIPNFCVLAMLFRKI